MGLGSESWWHATPSLARIDGQGVKTTDLPDELEKCSFGTTERPQVKLTRLLSYYPTYPFPAKTYVHLTHQRFFGR